MNNKNYITLLIVIILILVIIIVYMNRYKYKNNNKLIINEKGCSNCMLGGSNRDKFDYCIDKNKIYYDNCPLNKSSDSEFNNINLLSNICKFDNLNIFGCTFNNSNLLTITNCYFGYTSFNKTLFKRCKFENIENTVFDRVIFYKYNELFNVKLNNITFDDVKFLDQYYLFNFESNILMFYNLSIGTNTVIQFTGNLPNYVNLRANINTSMVLNGVYEFDGYKYKLIFNNNNSRYTFLKIL